MTGAIKGLSGWSFKETSKGTAMEGLEWLGFEQVNRSRARVVIPAQEVGDFHLIVVLDKKEEQWICSVSIKELRNHEGHKVLKTVAKESLVVATPLDIVSFARNTITKHSIPDTMIPKGW
jgi:hypothetical protein